MGEAATVPTLSTLPAAQRDAALARFAFLRPHLEDGVPLARLAREGAVPPRTARRWLARYRRAGLAGLARWPRADRGQRKVAADLQGLVEGLALQRPRRSIAAIHRQVVAVAAERGWPAPSYGCVYDIVRRLGPALLTLAHDGAQGYAQAFELLHRREATAPNAIWQADHTQLDLWLLNEHGQPARPWLTIVLDDFSRIIAGYYLTFVAPSALGTALALHQALWRKGDARWPVCGIPDVFYTDHGSDFTSRHLEQVAADLGMQLVYSTRGRPRGRGKIERFFGTVNQLLLGDLPGYAPAGGAPAIPTLTLPTFEARFRAWLLDDYHRRIHGETRQAPLARWEAGGFLPRLPESLEELDLLLLTVTKARRVQRDGIHFQGLRYLDPTLAAYVGEDVTIRYDPRDLAEVRVYHRGTFIGRAICPELAGEALGLRELVRARNEQRGAVRRELRDRAAIVERLLALRQGAPPPVEPAAAPPQAGPAAPRLKRYRHE